MLLNFASFCDSIRNCKKKKNNEENHSFQYRRVKGLHWKKFQKPCWGNLKIELKSAMEISKNCFRYTGTDFSASEESTLMFAGLIVTIGGLFVLG